MASTTDEELGFYSFAEAEALTSLSRVTIWRRVRAQDFPPPVTLTPGRVGFPRAAVNEWLRNKERGGDVQISRLPPKRKSRKDTTQNDEAA